MLFFPETVSETIGKINTQILHLIAFVEKSERECRN